MRAEPSSKPGRLVVTRVPQRLERLRWSRFHTLVVAALGITWILDGLEVTLAGSVSGALKASPALHLTDSDVGLAGGAYVLGAVIGAVGFGWLTDRLGRKTLFFATILVYLIATALTGLSWSASSFFVFRFLTGCGIGGEYSAINSTIQELVPARYRGHTDLVINGSFWVGAALGALVSLLLLDSSLLPPDLGWRLAFLAGAALGAVVFFMRMWIPESPRWLVMHGREAEAEAVVADIEARCETAPPREDEMEPLRLRVRDHTPLSDVFNVLFRVHLGRTLVGLTLMAAQAFFYNAIFFTYALVLTEFYAVPANAVGWYVLPFALGNFLGPVLLGRLFDTVGRRTMIALTYGLSGLLLIGVGFLFERGALTALTQTLGWMAVFFVASPAASSAYLTVSETFPIEMRALAIAFFYAIGTGLGGIAGPIVFSRLIESGSRSGVFAGYAGASALMGLAAFVARWAVPAERRALEDVAKPLSAE